MLPVDRLAMQTGISILPYAERQINRMLSFSQKEGKSVLQEDIFMLGQRFQPEHLPLLTPPKKNWKQQLEARFLLTTEDVKRYRGDVKLCNLHYVDEYLIRGAMPESEAAFEKLKNYYGVTTVIDLRGLETTKPEHFFYEKMMAEKYGLRYKNIQLDSKKPPSKKALREFFEEMQKTINNEDRVFIHCKHGIDRAGSMVVAYERFFKDRTVDQAFKDMKRYGYNWIHQWKKPAQEAFIKNGQLDSLLKNLTSPTQQAVAPLI